MNRILYNFLGLCGVLMLWACKDTPIIENDALMTSPVFKVNMMVSEPATKTAITIEGSGNNRVGHINWASGDKVGMFVEIDDTQMQQNIEFTNTANNTELFSGSFIKKNTSSIGGASFYAYYPYIATDICRYFFKNNTQPDFTAFGEIPVCQEGDFGRYDFMVAKSLQNADYDEESLSKNSEAIDLSFPGDRQLFKTLRMVLPRITVFPAGISKSGSTYDVKVSRIKITADQPLVGQFMVDLSAATPVAVFDTVANLFFPINNSDTKAICTAFENPMVLDDGTRRTEFYFTLREKSGLGHLKIVFETQYGQVEFRTDTLALDRSVNEIILPSNWSANSAHWTYNDPTNPTNPYVDMSTNGTANCYVLKPNTSYKFRVNKKGNGMDYENSTAGDYALDSYSATIDLSAGAYYLRAVLLWEAASDNDNNTDIITYNGVSYKDSCIYVTTGSSQGNAVVALEERVFGGYEILWSWHLWVTNEADLINAQSKVDPVRKMMLCNLGAIDNQTSANHPHNRGLLYQWGRKDPFLPSKNTSATYRSNAKGNGIGKWKSTSNAYVSGLLVHYSLDYSIRNPMTFIYNGSGVVSKDWYYTMYVYNNNLWGGGYFVKNTKNSSLSNTLTNVTAKTMFDPCPVGYRMPVVGAYGYTAYNSTEDYLYDIWDCLLMNGNTVVGAKTIGGAFFPATGRLSYDAALKYEAFDALSYWFGSVAADVSGENFEESKSKRYYGTTFYIKKDKNYNHGFRIEPSNFAEKASGRPVRCILEDYFVPHYDWSGM